MNDTEIRKLLADTIAPLAEHIETLYGMVTKLAAHEAAPVVKRKPGRPPKNAEAQAQAG